MLTEVQRDEGRTSGVGPRRVIFTGSREWGLTKGRGGLTFIEEKAKQELQVSAAAVNRLIARYVVGITDDFAKRDRTAVTGPGLIVVQGGANGLDTKVANAVQTIAFGLWRRSRREFSLYTNIVTEEGMASTELADGLWLETYEADWANRPRYLAGPERNQRMLDEGADHVIAMFAWGRSYGATDRGGTNDMVRRAVKAGVPVDIYEAALGKWRKP